MINILISSVVSSLASAFLLWIIGKKREYDFLFKHLLLIYILALIVGYIPFIGLYAQALIFVGLFCKLEDLPIVEAMWVGIIAFVVKVGLILLILMTITSLQEADILPRQTSAAPELTDNQTSAIEFLQEAYGGLSNSVAASEKQVAPSADQIRKAFRLSGIATRNSERVAVINGKPVREGDRIDHVLTVEAISNSHIVVSSEGTTFKLYPAP